MKSELIKVTPLVNETVEEAALRLVREDQEEEKQADRAKLVAILKQGAGYQALVEEGHSQRKVAKLCGVSNFTVSQYLKVLGASNTPQLAKKLEELADEGKLSLRAALRVVNPPKPRKPKKVEDFPARNACPARGRKEYNPHPEQADVGDCCVRAYCAAVGVEYEEAVKELQVAAEELGGKVPLRCAEKRFAHGTPVAVFSLALLKRGWLLRQGWHRGKVLNLDQLAARYARTNVFAFVSNHCVALVRGEQWDTGVEKRRDQLVGFYFLPPRRG